MSFKKFMVANRTILAISLAGVLVVTGVVLAIVLTRVPRSSILRIANWDYFMDRELVAEFQESWREITGDRRFRVRYTLFDSNEELYRMMDRNRADFDLVVPSEYMVEKMIGENLLKPLDMARLPELTQVIPTAVGPTRVFDETIIDPYITNAILNVTGGVNYAIPYAYGTLGIVYDTSVAGLGDFIRANGWRSLFVQNEDWFASPTTEQNSWRQSVKNIGRDTYTIALLAYYQDQLEAYIAMDNATGIAGHTALMNRIFAGVKHTTGANQGQFNTEEMASMRNTARDVLMTLPRDVMFEGPDQLLNDIYRFAGTAANNSSRRAVFGFEWSVSAVFAKYMNEAESVGFYVPQMGTNLWINSLVIPRRAQNLDAAYAFINFIKSREIAATNAFTHCGATPIMGAAADIMEMLVDTITFPTTAPVTHYSTRTWLEAQRDIYLEGTSTMTAAAINAEIDGFISWQAMLIASFPRSFGTLEGGASGNFNLGGIFRYFSDGLDVEVDMMLNGVRTATRPAR